MLPDTTARTVRSAHAQLRSAQKPPQGTAAYSRFVNRPAGRVLASIAFARGLSPNQVSYISGGLSLAGIVLVALGPATVLTGLAVTVLLALGYAMDSADGQVARLTHGGSRTGEWLDHMIDAVKTSSLHVAVAIHLYRAADVDPRWMLVPLAFVVVATTLFFGMMLTDQMRTSSGVMADRSQGSLSVARSIALLPSDYGALILVFLLLGWSTVFVGAYALLLVGMTALLVAALVRWSRIVRLIDEEAFRA